MLRGHELLSEAEAVANNESMRAADRKLNAWSDYNVELLRQSFNTEEQAVQYQDSVRTYSFGGSGSFAEDKAELIRRIGKHVAALESVEGRIDLWESEAPAAPVPPPKAATPASRRVFVVHGRDAEAKATVARFLSRLSLEPIILHEQPNQGRTLIEKFEMFADVRFAIVLLTPDDAGHPRDTPEDSQPRPRQNVVLELGYFLGKLGRSNVCALVRSPIELPTDYDGVVYVPMDDGEGWKLQLAKEIRSVIPIDMNLAV